MFISTFIHKTKKVLGISLGVIFVSYLLNTLSTLSNSVEFLKYLSVFTLADIRNVIINVLIQPIMIVITFLLVIVFSVLTLINYNKKSLI